MDHIHKIAVAGAGAMGAGIAQLAAHAGFDVILYDIAEKQTVQAKQSIQTNLDKAVSKGMITNEQADKTLGSIHFTNDLAEVKADMVIEAVVENLDVKRELFLKIAGNNQPGTILATNTSSFSITRIANGIPNPERVAGMHFFNPAHIMKLVEVITGVETSQKAVEAIKGVAEKMGKTVVIAKDSPGFIVNRVARHYYVESLKIMEEQVATFEVIDDLAEATGFKMGPFRLQDMIGIDINYAVTQSLFEAFFYDPKFRPNRIQQQRKEAGHLGRKTGLGYYRY